MFIGHYGIAFGLKKFDQTISLGLLFLAVQFVDILWTIFVFFGIERVEIVPGITKANPLNFVYYPFTHSLIATLFWGAIAYLVFRFLIKRKLSANNKTAIIIAAAVLSHFVLDLLAHRPDLPVFTNDSFKMGLGLWNYVLISYFIETLIFAAGLWKYYQITDGKTFGAKYGMLIFAVILVIFNTINLIGPPPPDINMLAIFGLTNYLILAAVAFWLDKKRVAINN